MASNVEYRQPDADGRIALSGREYTALRAIYGAVNVLEVYHGELERRCRGIKYGWRDLRCLLKLSERVLDKILETVPIKKLMQMRVDLDNTVCEVKTKGITGQSKGDCIYVPDSVLIDLCKAATNVACFGCDRSHEDARRHCQLYKDIQAVFPYEFDKGGTCPFAEG